jgi:2-hydroxyacyl-CoA lyase 1
MIQGFQVVAKALALQGLSYSFGIVGIPVSEIAMSLQANDVNYYGFRNEQAAAYAASAVGYITKRPGIVLAVSGPGMTNCISGMANAMVNKWPMIVIAGASDASLDGKGAF